MQCSNSFVGNVVSDDAPELRGQRQHGAKDFADGRDVVLRDPAAQLHQFGRERGSGIEHLAQATGLELGFAIVQLGDDAAEPLLAEGHDDAAADAGFRRVLGKAIGEDGVERNRHGHIAELRHGGLAAFGRALGRGQIEVAHDHLQVFPGFLLLPRIAQQKRRMVGDRQLAREGLTGIHQGARR